MANPAASLSNALGDRIMLYFIKEGNLVLEMPPINVDDREVVYTGNGAPKGNFAMKNCIASAWLYGLPTVFGMMQYGELEDKKLILSQMSPIINIALPKARHKDITTSEDCPSVAGASDGRSRAWIYFMKKNDSDKLFIWQMTIRPEGDSATSLTKLVVPPAKESRLAAVYEPTSGKRFVFYQPQGDEDSEPIKCFVVDKETDVVTIPGSEGAMKGTPLGACIGPDGVMYLYWRAAQKLQRATRTKDGQWSMSTTAMKFVDQRTDIMRSSQLSVTQMGPNLARSNHVFFIDSDSQAGDYVDHVDTGLLGNSVA